MSNTEKKKTNPLINYVNIDKLIKNDKMYLYNTVGIIIDATNPYKALDSHDYLTKIKIIDNQINHINKKIETDFVHVFIYHKKLEDSPNVSNIGDFLSLRNFKFEESKKNKKEIYAKFNYESEWAIITEQNYKDFKNIEKKKNICSNKSFNNMNIFPFIEKNLYKFRETFFSKYSLEEMNWYSKELPKNIDSKYIVEQYDIDILVKIVEIESFKIDDELVYYKIIFVDKNQELYFSELKNEYLELNKNDCYKLRSIRIYHKENQKKIEFRSYSRLLKLLNFSKDYKVLKEKSKNVTYDEDIGKLFFENLHLEKKKNENKSSKNLNLFYDDDEEEEEVEKEDKFKDYFIKNNSKSQVKNEHENLKKITNNISKEFKNKNTVYRIEAKVTNFKHKNYKDCFKLFCEKENKYYEFSEFKKLNKKKLVVVFLNSFQLLGNDSEIIIDTTDGNPSYLFDRIVDLPDIKNINSWVNLEKNSIKNLNNALKNFGSNNEKYELIIEKSKNNLRLIDTLLS